MNPLGRSAGVSSKSDKTVCGRLASVSSPFHCPCRSVCRRLAHLQHCLLHVWLVPRGAAVCLLHVWLTPRGAAVCLLHVWLTPRGAAICLLDVWLAPGSAVWGQRSRVMDSWSQSVGYPRRLFINVYTLCPIKKTHQKL